jgi:hypothetical protein
MYSLQVKSSGKVLTEMEVNEEYQRLTTGGSGSGKRAVFQPLLTGGGFKRTIINLSQASAEAKANAKKFKTTPVPMKSAEEEDGDEDKDEDEDVGAEDVSPALRKKIQNLLVHWKQLDAEMISVLKQF